MDNLPNKADLRDGAIERRDAYLEDMKDRVRGIVDAGGDVTYDQAMEAAQASIRFAAQIASVVDLT